MNRDALQHELTQRGLSLRVESRDRLAVLILSDGAPMLASETTRRDLQALASKHGFTHVAVELTEAWCSDASLPRRQSD